MSGLIIRVQHMRAAGYCAAGARDFCRRHEIDWLDFIHNGIDSERLTATGDAMAAAVVEIAERERVANG